MKEVNLVVNAIMSFRVYSWWWNLYAVFE